MQAWSAFYPFIEHLVPGCPLPLIDQSLRRAAIDFCERSNVWQETLPPLAVTANVSTYVLDTPVNAEVVRVMKVAPEDRAPLTQLRPKALCPVANIPLADWGVARLAPHVGRTAVNVHHHREQMTAHLADRGLHLSVEEAEALGTAGALGALRDWVAGDAVLLTNADSWSPLAPDPLAALPSLECAHAVGAPQHRREELAHSPDRRCH